MLAKMSRKLPIFPDVENQRYMLYIENLCEFLCQIMMRGEDGIFWPQNSKYTETSEMVKLIAKVTGHKIHVSRLWNWIPMIASHIPGKVGDMANKAFGNLCYDREISTYDFDYQLVSFEESIVRIEGCRGSAF